MPSKTFLTGCDENTEWQLPWFITNLRQHTDFHLLIADFGMSETMLDSLKLLDNVTCFSVQSNAKGWFKKPMAMLQSSKMDYDKVCWLDTDCEVTCPTIETIFNWTEEGKLGMVEDRPWTKRRGNMGIWHNSGVVVFQGSPNILKRWSDECIANPVQGDQETLYGMIRGNDIVRMGIIRSIPHRYNTLRLDYIDNIASKRPCVIHHTGHKGNLIIKRKIG
jgi:hypothetical protein